MIGKTIIGTSFGGCVRYLFAGHKNSQEEKWAEVLEAIGVRDDSAASMTADFNRGRRLNPSLGRAVWHTSISFNPDDSAKLTNSKMLAVAYDYLAGMGLDNTQYAIIRHNDKEHPHFHIVANRVANDGQTISDSHNYKRSEHILKQLSQKHELTPVQGKRTDRIKEKQLKGDDKIRYQIFQAVQQALEGCTSGLHFDDVLKKQDITYQIHKNKAGNATGISFKKGDHCFKGSQVDRKLSLAGILAQIKKNQPSEPQLSAVEGKWQQAYKQYVEKQIVHNQKIKTNNEWISKAAEALQQNPSVELAQSIAKQAPSEKLQQALKQQIQACQVYEQRQKWILDQRQKLTLQAWHGLGMSAKAREAKQKLEYLNNPEAYGLGKQMEEKHYTFWLHAKDANQKPPIIGFDPKPYQETEQSILSLKEFAQKRETNEQQRQVQEAERQQRQTHRPRIGS